MASRTSWKVAGMVGLPLLTFTAYLVWIWPWPPGTSLPAQLGPYLVSLATGLPFAWSLGRGPGRVRRVLVYLLIGFVLLWIHALAVLCGVRGVCL